MEYKVCIVSDNVFRSGGRTERADRTGILAFSSSPHHRVHDSRHFYVRAV
jgi:hypothetical protein